MQISCQIRKYLCIFIYTVSKIHQSFTYTSEYLRVENFSLDGKICLYFQKVNFPEKIRGSDNQNFMNYCSETKTRTKAKKSSAEFGTGTGVS